MDEIFVEQIVKRKTGISVVLMRVFSIIVLIKKGTELKSPIPYKF